ncbi:MAG: hypothetical protein ABIU06_03460 [Anaerolineales bacterium]
MQTQVNQVENLKNQQDVRVMQFPTSDQVGIKRLRCLKVGLFFLLFLLELVVNPIFNLCQRRKLFFVAIFAQVVVPIPLHVRDKPGAAISAFGIFHVESFLYSGKVLAIRNLRAAGCENLSHSPVKIDSTSNNYTETIVVVPILTEYD